MRVLLRFLHLTWFAISGLPLFSKLLQLLLPVLVNSLYVSSGLLKESLRSQKQSHVLIQEAPGARGFLACSCTICGKYYRVYVGFERFGLRGSDGLHG